VETLDLGSEDGVMATQHSTGRPTSRRYSDEEKAQAVRLVRQLEAETGKRFGAIKRVAEQLGYGLESVRSWVNRADVDAGTRPGTTSEDAARIRALEQENRELRRANDILKAASAFFAAELDRPLKR
jgi:transposase